MRLSTTIVKTREQFQRWCVQACCWKSNFGKTHEEGLNYVPTAFIHYTASQQTLLLDQ